MITSYTATKAPGPKNAMDDGSDKDAGIDSLAEETDSNEPIMIPSGPGIEHFEGWN